MPDDARLPCPCCACRLRVPTDPPPHAPCPRCGALLTLRAGGLRAVLPPPPGRLEALAREERAAVARAVPGSEPGGEGRR